MKCFFCKNDIETGKGKMKVKNDGRVFYFCRAKCEKSWEKGRKSRNLKWASKK